MIKSIIKFKIQMCSRIYRGIFKLFLLLKSKCIFYLSKKGKKEKGNKS